MSELKKVAVVIPTYSASQALCEVAVATGKGWRALADDLICVDDVRYCKAIADICDTYIVNEGGGVAINTNIGWRMALEKGADYVAMMDMDCSWVEGSLRRACIPGHVSVPSLLQFPEAINIGPMFIVPKEVSDEYGFFDESVKAYDTDYGVRVFGIMTQVRSLRVNHPGGIVTGVNPQHPQ